MALYLRGQVRDLLGVDEDYEPPEPLHAAILECLATRGASFLVEIEDAVADAATGHGNKELRAAIWDLVWAGQITNDTFAPLRDLARTTPRRGRRRGVDLLAGGRWSLVSSLVKRTASPTARAVAHARLLLDRYGVVSRQCARAEEIPGGFAAIYKVLREMEEQGRVRRGHFVDGLQGAQFAYAGAVDRLRAQRDEAEERDRPVGVEDLTVLSAMDPANPFGALVGWPSTADDRQPTPRRVAGAWVFLARGRPVLYAGPRARSLMTFPATLRDLAGCLDAAIEALRHLPRGATRGMLTIEKIDGVAAAESSLLPAFREAGFALDYRGLIDVRPVGVGGGKRAGA